MFLIFVCVFLLEYSVLSTDGNYKTSDEAPGVIIRMAEESLVSQFDQELFEFTLQEKWIPENVKLLSKDEIVSVELYGRLKDYSNFRVTYLDTKRGTIQHRFVQLQVGGRVKAYAVQRELGKGRKITKDKIQTIWVPFEEQYKQYVTNREEILGSETVKTLKPGQAIRFNDIKTPSILEAGADVSLLFKNGALVLSLQCESMDDAALGEEVSIYCKDQRTRYLGIVEGPRMVSWAKTL